MLNKLRALLPEEHHDKIPDMLALIREEILEEKLMILDMPEEMKDELDNLDKTQLYTIGQMNMLVRYTEFIKKKLKTTY